MFRNGKRCLAFFIGLCLILTAVFSLVYVTQGADHDCAGEHCAICIGIHHAEQTLHMLSSGAEDPTAAALPPIALLTVLLIALPMAVRSTLVAQKIRKND